MDLQELQDRNGGNIYGRHPNPTTPRRASGADWSRADHLQAITHCMTQSFGLGVRDMHPLAEAALSDGRPYTFLDAAEGCMYTAGHHAPAGGDGYNTIRAALSTPDFGTVITETVRGIARERRSEALASILALTHQLEVPDYRAMGYSMVDLEGLPAPSEITTNRYYFATVIPTGEQIAVHSLLARILVTRQALVNDDRGFVAAAINAFLRSAHSNELGMITGLLESNANMQDGAPIFHGDHGNLTTAALDAGGLGTAFSTLRKQKTEGGDVSDATPAVMLVHSDDEAAALALTEALPEDRRPRVVSTARLANADSWYLLADPRTFPCIGRVRMEGAELSAVSFGGFEPAVETLDDGTTREFNGVALPATHSVGYSVLSRIGAVKLTKT
jgi:hypothetical protein